MRSVQNKNTFMVTEAGQKTDLRICDCGVAEYRKILKLQMQLQEKRRRDEIPNTVLIVEHQPAITLGAQKRANKLLVSKEELKKRGVDVVEIRRGGGVTAHNPGQIVLYPILGLQQLNLGISEYIKKLEKIGQELLAQLGVLSQPRKGFPGLWMTKRDTRLVRRLVLRSFSEGGSFSEDGYEIRDTKKIASIGVRVSRFVTYHGMAININNDLSIFDLFVPCGIEGVRMTSVLKQTGKKYSMNDVKGRLAELLTKYFTVKSATYENRSQVTSMA